MLKIKPLPCIRECIDAVILYLMTAEFAFNNVTNREDLKVLKFLGLFFSKWRLFFFFSFLDILFKVTIGRKPCHIFLEWFGLLKRTWKLLFLEGSLIFHSGAGKGRYAFDWGGVLSLSSCGCEIISILIAIYFYGVWFIITNPLFLGVSLFLFLNNNLFFLLQFFLLNSLPNDALSLLIWLLTTEWVPVKTVLWKTTRHHSPIEVMLFFLVWWELQAFFIFKLLRVHTFNKG